jgi:hypothetical protein
MSRLGKSCIKLTGGIDPVDWLFEGLSWSGFLDVLTGLSEGLRGAVRDIVGDPLLSQPSS